MGNSEKNPAKEEAEALKAKADALAAEAAAAEAQRKLTEQDSPLAKLKREAEDKKAIAEAEGAVATAQQGQLTALLPDLSKVERGSLEVKEGQALFGSALAQRALSEAAKTVATESIEALDGKSDWRILVTSDAQLATSDSVYLDVTTGLDQLNTAAEKTVSETVPEGGVGVAALTPAAAAAAIATALPGALSLLSAHRTLSSASVTVGNLAAAAATAGSLKRQVKSGTVVHDDVRTLPSGGIVHAKLATLDQRRQSLVGHKIALEDEKAETTEDVTSLQESVKELAKEVEAASASEKPALQSKLDNEKAELATRRQQLSKGTVRLGLVDSVIAAIDAFTTSLRTTAPGATRSPLATAVLREQLHQPACSGDGQPSGFSHVLFVQAEPGSTHQVVDDRPLWRKDKFSAVGVVNVTYMLIALPGSEIQAAGSASGKAVVKGTLGGEIEIENES